MNRNFTLAILVGALCFSANAIHADPVYQELHEQAWASDVPEQVDKSEFPPPDLGAEVLSRDAVVREVQRRNPSVAVALNTWRAALAQYPQAKSLPDPTLAYGAAPRTFGRSDIDAGQRLEFSQRFPWPGIRRLMGQKALTEADARYIQIDVVRNELAYQASNAFYDYWYAHRALDINAANSELMDEYLDTAESSYAAGIATRQDALQAEVEREELSRQAIALQRFLNVTRARINTLLHREPQSALAPPPLELPTPGPIPAPELLQSVAQQNRPELHALSRQVEAGDLGVDSARKDFYPNITVFGTYNSLWKEEEKRPLIGASINLPIRLGRRRAAVDQARAQRLRAQAELQRSIQDVAYEVQQTYETLREQSQNVGIYRDRLLPVAKENLEAATAGYSSGQEDFLALLTAQKRLMDTQLSLSETLASYHQSVAGLERAIGASLRNLPVDVESQNDERN